MSLHALADCLPKFLRDPARRLYRKFSPPQAEPIMYRIHLFQELLEIAGPDAFDGKRILEIGPRDGLDSIRLSGLNPTELIMIDLPEKQAVTAPWLAEIACPHRYIEANFMYMTESELGDIGRFDLIWCTGVLYHNAEQLRFLRKLYKRLNVGGRLVLESATLRGPKRMRDGEYVRIYYPETYRNTGTITHLPSANAIKAWLKMAGFTEIVDSHCFEHENRNVLNQRMAAIAHKTSADDAGVYYGKSGLNPNYRFGDSQ